MQRQDFGATIGRKLRAAAGIGLVIAGLSIIASPAKARHRHVHHRHGFAYSHSGRFRDRYVSVRYHGAHANLRDSRLAAIVVDANSGQTLYSSHENEERFPASITKVMTLYLLFDELEQGHLGLDSDIRVSSFAAAQKPTKLGLRPGQSIAVDDAIKAIVTRSANDIAVAIAERIGGDESHFAAMMTQKARELGMNSTHFANASGLPNANQLTTAHDLAILGRAIQERFPRYYRYFATRVFHYGRAAIVNHNHLLGRIEGMDGIKTGYTNASGFNLLTSVKRNGHYIVAVVLGGASAHSRDHLMADLIEDHIESSATVRTASALSGLSANAQVPKAKQNLASSAPSIDSAPRNGLRPAFVPDAPGPGLSTDPVRLASLSSDPVAATKPRPAFVSGAPKRTAPENAEPGAKQARLDGSTGLSLPSGGSGIPATTPSALHAGSSPAQSHAAKFTNRIGEPLPVVTARTGDVPNVTDVPNLTEEHTGWMIQIGATPDVDKATALLARARSEGPKTLSRARPFTERIQKGSATLYRARFAGLEEETATLVCKSLKRSGFSCFATRN